jgi:putative inorganic carbon (hco3(-)) transporter
VFSPFQPFVYLVAYLAFLYIRPHQYVEALNGVPVLPVLQFLVFVFWITRQAKTFEASQYRLLPVLTLLMAFSVALSGWVGGAISVLTDFGTIVLLFFMLATTVDSLAKLRVIFLLLTIASFIMALHGIDQTNNELGIGWTGAAIIEGRITYLGFANDPNDLAMTLLMSLPMCLHLAQRSGFVFRWSYRVVAGFILYGVYLTNSRGAILGLGAIILAYAIRRYGLWRSLIVVPFMGAPLILLAPSRMAEMSAEEDSAAGRVEAWYEGFEMLRAHPLFGVGKGLFTDHHYLTAHNSYMLAMAELGLVGYFVWLSIIVLTMLMLWVMIRPEASLAAEPVVAPALALAGDGEPAQQPGVEDNASFEDYQQASRTLLYGMVAALVCAFFLSRSYVVILYVQMALVVAVSRMMRAQWPSMPSILFAPLWPKLLTASLSSVVALWLVMKLLL